MRIAPGILGIIGALISLLIGGAATAQVAPATGSISPPRPRTVAAPVETVPPVEDAPAPEAAPMPTAQPRWASGPAPAAPGGSAEAATGYSVNGLGFEASTATFASGGLAGLLVGWKGPKIVVGANLGFMKVGATDSASGASMDTVAVRLGPGLRLVLLSSEDQRAELYLHGDLNLIIINSSASAGGASATATGAAFQLNAGAGVRYWIHPNLAIGYVAIVKFTSEPSQPSQTISIAVPPAMGTLGWFLDGQFVITAAF